MGHFLSGPSSYPLARHLLVRPLIPTFTPPAWPTGALLAIKPEATTIGTIARWPLENNLDVWWAKLLRCDWLFAVTNVSCQVISIKTTTSTSAWRCRYAVRIRHMLAVHVTLTMLMARQVQVTAFLSMRPCCFTGLPSFIVAARAMDSFSENRTQKDCREHSKTLRWRCWISDSQPLRWRWISHHWRTADTTVLSSCRVCCGDVNWV